MLINNLSFFSLFLI